MALWMCNVTLGLVSIRNYIQSGKAVLRCSKNGQRQLGTEV